MINNPDQYPFFLLPLQIQDVIYEVHELTKAPIPLICSSAISAMSFAVQHNARVVRPNGMQSPLHLYSLTIAESGERKTTVDNLFFGHIGTWLAILETAYAARQTKYEVEFEEWQTKKKGLLLAIKKDAKDGVDSPSLKTRLATHHANKPKAPPAPDFMYRDVTIEALLPSLQAWPSAIITSSEAGMLFNGRTFNALETYNALWDGSTASLHRKNVEPVQVSGASLTVSLMAQPQVVKDFLSNKGSSARGNGFLARCLICFPTSTQGTRYQQPLSAPPTPKLDAFRERMRELLNCTIDDDGRLTSETQTVSFSWAAQEHYLEFYNSVESQLGFNGYFSDVKDAASKIGENMARIAAILHCFTGQTGPIDIGTANQASAIARWYLVQFKLLFGNNMVMSQEEMDIQILSDWFRNNAFKYGYEVPKSIVLRYGPNHLRSKAALDPVLMNMEARQLIINGKRNKTLAIQMTQALFPPHQALQ